ncbi:MAG: trehalase family glycosidase [Bacteroidota bacterium]
MEQIVKQAKQILELNWKDGFTIPTGKLYPFQWNWDSGFTSIGHSYFSLDNAIKELESLFSGQWENGMVPHIIFHSENEKTYFPNFDFWHSNVNSGAPQKPKSSGITQPSVHGFILENLLNKFPGNEKLETFVKAIFPKVVNYHRFLYTYRDPEREGLMFIFHPWESGRDNSPLWDQSLERIVIDKATLPAYTRRDTSIAPTDERPTSRQYDCYVYLLQLGKINKYDEKGIFEESPFLVQDTLMNAVLIRSNESLIRIGKKYGLDTGEIEEWQQQAKPAFAQKLWNEALNTFTPYDVRGGHHISHKEIGAYTALYANIPTSEQAQRLNDDLWSLHESGYYICPSFDPDSDLFDSKRYWRGPIWPQMNWMIHFGLKQYGFGETADVVKSDIIELVTKLGFYEYFEAQKSQVNNIETGYGGSDFSWTAACVLDLFKST